MILENFDQLYSVYVVALLGYPLLIFAPSWRYTNILVPIIAFAPALLYFLEFLYSIKNPNGMVIDMSTLQGFKDTFKYDIIALMAWAHFNCTDLLAAWLMVLYNEEKKELSRYLMGPLLVVWWLMAPVAYTILFVIFSVRYLMSDKNQVDLSLNKE